MTMIMVEVVVLIVAVALASQKWIQSLQWRARDKSFFITSTTTINTPPLLRNCKMAEQNSSQTGIIDKRHCVSARNDKRVTAVQKDVAHIAICALLGAVHALMRMRMNSWPSSRASAMAVVMMMVMVVMMMILTS